MSRDLVHCTVTEDVPASATVTLPSCFGATESRDNVGVSGYGVYLNGRLRGTTSNTQYSLSGLACGTGYTVGVDVLDTPQEPVRL